jgi:hypothetical protein
MESKISASRSFDPVRQFSLFAENKVGCLHDFVSVLANNDVHIMAITAIDSTDASIVRFVVDDPKLTRDLLRKHGFSFTESDVIGVELSAEPDLQLVLSSMMEAEVNIHYLYPFLIRPKERYALVLNVDDPELATQALSLRSFKVLGQSEISR